jgi:hypothetical protein
VHHQNAVATALIPGTLAPSFDHVGLAEVRQQALV